mgnify:CR=1 FL=1
MGGFVFPLKGGGPLRSRGEGVIFVVDHILCSVVNTITPSAFSLYKASGTSPFQGEDKPPK